MVKLQAHRGVSSDRPENTMVAYREAIIQGYDLVELDPKFTADNKCVLLHDKTLNRTARDKNGLPPAQEKLSISSVTYAQACEYEYGSWFDKKYTGEHMPTLKEALEFSKETGMPLKFDNVMQGFTDEQFYKAQGIGLSDARLYKMAGNAVSVPVITALGEIIKRVHENKTKEADNG